MTPASSGAPAVSVILVTYNAWEHTRRCLGHLLAEPFAGGLEVILVDNASEDGTVAAVKREFPAVTVVENPDNLGFGRACNLGVERAGGEYAVLLNNDAMLDSGQLKGLLDAYRRHALTGIYTARIVDESGEEEASCFRDQSPGQLLRDAFRVQKKALADVTYALAGIQDEALEVEACSGAFWLFAVDTWRQVGGFDEAFFMYYEDRDLCRRWRLAGHPCHVNTTVTIVHSCGGSARDPVARGVASDVSLRLFYRKHYGVTGALAARLFQVIRSAPRLLVHGLLALSPHQRSECRLHFFQLSAALTKA